MHDDHDIPLLERQLRRRDWTSGSPVVLADGSCWQLPRIDEPLFITTEGLQAEFLAALQLASQAEGTPSFSMERIRYQTQLANIGCHLLMRNYELRDEDCQRLVEFSSLVDLFLFTRTVATVLDSSRARREVRPGRWFGKSFSAN